MKILFASMAPGTTCTSTDGYDQIIRIGSVVYYQFGGAKYKIANVGETVNIRVEIRDVDPTHPDSINVNLEFKLFVNGELVATRQDQVDAGSGKYDTMPLEVRVGPVKAARDIFLTFTNTYLDIYK